MTAINQPFPFTPELALDLWYTALGEEIGIVIPVADPKTVLPIQARIYDARKDINDPRLSVLSSYIPADASAIYIYKREVELE